MICGGAYWFNYVKAKKRSTHLSNQGERCWLQYTFVNPLESGNTNFTKSILIMILRPDGGLFEKIDFEIEAFALKKTMV